MPTPIVKIFNDSGCATYLIGCPDTRRAVLVDPKAGKTKTYEKACADFGLAVDSVFETHTHADHLSASAHYLAAGITVRMSRHTHCRRAITKVADGEPFAVGALAFRICELPGHTPDSIGFVGHGLAVVGDTLFAGGLARADFRGSDPAALWTSIRTKILALDDATVVFPGHGYADILFTTVGHEKAHNAALRHASGEAYAQAAALVPGAGNSPEVDATLAANESTDAAPEQSSGAVAACCAMGSNPGSSLARPLEALPAALAGQRERLTREGLWFDVRDRHEYAADHIPGARNIPLGELGFHLCDFADRRGLVFSCAGGVRSMSAARTLSYLGVAVEPTSMTGGFQAWKAAGLETER